MLFDQALQGNTSINGSAEKRERSKKLKRAKDKIGSGDILVNNLAKVNAMAICYVLYASITIFQSK